jgi:pimeloyl-ACP methyl ester carboxylesterase
MLKSLVIVMIVCAFVSAPTVARSPRSGPATTRSESAPAPSPPASMAEIAIPSGGARMNGLLYLAAGAEPHPVVIFLHGYPGNERNLDLAQAVRRAGYQALYVDYRGAWGSGGTFSFAHGLEDVAAVLAWVREPGNVAKYHLDIRHIALVGHSYGGWLALLSAAREAPGVCVAALAAWNVGWAAQRFEAHPDERSDNLNYFRTTTDPAGGPIRAAGDELLQEITAHATEWDYLMQAKPLADHTLLLIGATRDAPDAGVERLADLARAIRNAGGRRVRTVTYEDDHAFSSHRIELAQTLTHWLRYDCGFEAPLPRRGRAHKATRM